MEEAIGSGADITAGASAGKQQRAMVIICIVLLWILHVYAQCRGSPFDFSFSHIQGGHAMATSGSPIIFFQKNVSNYPTGDEAGLLGIPEHGTHKGRQVQADPGYAVLQGERHVSQHATHRDVGILVVLQLRIRLESAGLRISDSKWFEVFCMRKKNGISSFVSRHSTPFEVFTHSVSP